MEEKLEVSEIQKMQLEENTAQEKTRTYDISFKPTNWSDAQIFYGATQQIDIESLVQR